jgi:hypothetical protein
LPVADKDVAAGKQAAGTTVLKADNFGSDGGYLCSRIGVSAELIRKIGRNHFARMRHEWASALLRSSGHGCTEEQRNAENKPARREHGIASPQIAHGAGHKPRNRVRHRAHTKQLPESRTCKILPLSNN